MKTPRLKNLMQLSKALVLVSDGLSNLTVEDEAPLNAQFNNIPTPAELEAVADWIIDRVVSSTFCEMSALNGQDEISVFCTTCGDHTTHRRAVANGRNYYKCVQCGIVEELGVGW